MRRRWPMAIIVLTLGLVTPEVAAAPPADTIRVRVQPHAALVGGSIEVSIRIRCAPFGEHFESNVTATQDDQRIFAQRGLPVVRCDGRWHRYTVTATPFEGSFHRGRAFASAFVLRLDPDTGEERQGQDSRTVRIR